MPVDPQVPRIDDAVGACTTALVAARPSIQGKLEFGRYGNVVTGWRAQLAVLINRLADECRAGRLPLATGQALRDLLASRFDTLVGDGKATAVGNISLTRRIDLFNGDLNAFVIRKGTRFRRPANPNATPSPKQEISLETTQDTFWPQNSGGPIVVNVVASRPGTYANIPLDLSAGGVATDVVASDQLNDPSRDPGLPGAVFVPIVVGGAQVGGGSDGYRDADLVRIGQAVSRGRYSPVQAAVLAGALLGTGVRYARVQESYQMSRGSYRPQTYVSVADQSWGSSTRLVSLVQQSLNDNFVGFGCKATAVVVQNQFIKLDLAVTLRDGKLLGDTSPIDDAIRARMSRYFNERPDWDMWRGATIRALVASCDRRVQTCTSATVRDFQLNSSVFSDPRPPSAITDINGNPVDPANLLPFHWYLPDNAVAITYSAPT